jgi:hypothetical protein
MISDIFAKRLTGATSSRIAWMIYGPRVQFGDSLPDMMRPMNPMTSTKQTKVRGTAILGILGSMYRKSKLTQPSDDKWSRDATS